MTFKASFLKRETGKVQSQDTLIFLVPVKPPGLDLEMNFPNVQGFSSGSLMRLAHDQSVSLLD